MPTRLLYQEDHALLQSDATLESVSEDSGRWVLVLDRTVFHPQGGGQPYDQGLIRGPGGLFRVEEVRLVDGAVRHLGRFEEGGLAPGASVRCEVDAARRTLHSRIHSAGHVLDMAITRLGLGWKPAKGYHFPQGPYVEYVGDLEGKDPARLKADLEAACAALIAENPATECRVEDGRRLVGWAGASSPCGGTHVAALTEVGAMAVRKIKREGPHVRVGYTVA